MKVLFQIFDHVCNEWLQLRSVIDSLPGNIYWKDLKGNYVGRNAASIQSTSDQGYGGQDVLGKTDHDIFPQQIADEFVAHDKCVLEHDSEQVHEETVFMPDGRIDVHYSIKRPLRHDGKTIGVIGNSINITHLKKVEQEFEALQHKLEHAELSKETFLKNIEHDLKTPSSIIALSTQRLRVCQDEQEKRTLLDNIDFSSKQILDHFTQLIDFSRLNSEQSHCRKDDVCLEDLMSRIINGFCSTDSHPDLSIQYRLADDVPKLIYSSHYSLSRIMINLIENAVKFTQKGSILLSAECLDLGYSHDQALVLRCRDTGIGIANDHLESIFDPFFKINTTTLSHMPGSGLGLSIVKELVHQLRGKITVTSELGAGTEFVCQIPIGLSANSHTKDRMTVKLDHGIAINILLIEDNSICAKLTRELLEDRGYSVNVAETGERAHELVKNKAYDVILADIDLPDTNGFDLIQSLKAQHPKLNHSCIFMLSAHGSNAYAEELKLFDVSGYLSKPFDLDRFEELIKREERKHRRHFYN